MPLRDNSWDYFFNRNYDTLDLITGVDMYIKNNYTGAVSVLTGQGDVISCFTNSQDELSFWVSNTSTVTAISSFIDSTSIFFDLGDGTISNALTTTHYYKNAGQYKVTLLIVQSGGSDKIYKTFVSPTISARDYIPNKLYISYATNPYCLTSTLSNPLIITRYNSYQTYPTLSSTGYLINLSVSGNCAEYFSADEYYSDPYAHLKTFSAFMSVAPNGDFEVVDNFFSQADPIYGSRSAVNTYTLYSYPENGTILLGSSGSNTIYYYEDFII